MAKPMFLLAIVAGFVALSHQQTQDEVDAIREAIYDDIIMGNSVTRNGRVEFPRAAKLVRLSFYDCPGGCDGCVDTGNADNRGLETVIDELEALFNLAGRVSGQSISALMGGNTGDFYALAGLTGLIFAARMQRCRRREDPPPLPDLVFRIGRERAADCANNPPARSFPDSHHGFDDTMRYFRTQFNFNTQETTALLGVHTLGEASGQNSGFRGPWVRNKGALNNDYFTDMANANLNWTVRSVRFGDSMRWQWNHNGQDGTPMMLQADMCLLKRVNPAPTGQPTCAYNACQDSQTASLVREYAQNNEIWLTDFSVVYQKMIDKQSTGSLTGTGFTVGTLNAVCPDEGEGQPPPTNAPPPPEGPTRPPGGGGGGDGGRPPRPNGGDGGGQPGRPGPGGRGGDGLGGAETEPDDGAAALGVSLAGVLVAAVLSTWCFY